MKQQSPSFEARGKIFIASLVSYLLLTSQLVPMALAAKGTVGSEGASQGARSSTKTDVEPSANATAVSAPLLVVPSITATKTDSIPNANTVNPGDTLTYTIQITNSGTDATNVTLNDSVDPNTTIINSSVKSTPIAFPDTFSVIGNVRIQVPDGASDLLANDVDPDTNTNTGLTITTLAGDNSAPFSGTTSQNGQVTATAGDGSFVYNPAPGFTGTDTFTYVTTDSDGSTSTSTVTLNVTGLIWFVNAAAGPGGDGRLTSPFNCLVGAGCFDPVAADDPGDNIFLFSGSYSDTGTLTLLSTQKLIGQGATASLDSIAGVTVPTFSDPLPTTGGASPTITSAASAVNLGSGNTLRGFTIGNTTGTKISGNGFGNLTVGNNVSPDVTLNGSGQALSLTNGTLVATSAFVSVTSTSSTAQGIALTQVAGTFTLGGTTISGATTQGLSVSQSTVNASFGNTSVTGGTDAISLQNNSAGTRTFGTLSTLNNSGVGFLHAVGGGTTTAGATTITNPGGRGMDIQDSTTAITFGNTNVTQSGGTGIFIDDNLVGGTVTFADLDISPDVGQRSFQATDNLGTITSTSGTINGSATTNATTFEIAGTNAASRTPLAMVLDSITSNNDQGTGINLNFISGNLTVTTTTVSNPGTIGIQVQNSASGTINFGNTTVSGSGGTGVQLGTLSNGNSAGITFGDLDISPDAGVRALHAIQNTGAISATSGTLTTLDAVSDVTAVEIVGVSSASRTPLNISFTSVTAGGTPANGIILTNTSSTGSPGGFRILGNTAGICGGSVTNTTTPGTPATVTAANTADCSGGLISGATADGIRLQSVENVSLTRFRIINSGQSGIFGTDVNGFELISSFVSNNGNNVNEQGLRFTDVVNPGTLNGLVGSGIAGAFPTRIINSTIRQSGEFNVQIVNRTGILTDLLVDGCQFTDTNLNAGPADADGFNAEMQNTANGTIRLQNSFFSNNFTQGAQLSAIDSAVINATVSSSTFTNNNEGFICNHSASSDLICTVGGDAITQGNTFQNHPGASIVLSTGSTGTASASMTGKVKFNNVVSAASPVNHGVIVFMSGVGTPDSVTVSNNSVTQTVFGHAILVDTPDAGSSPQMSVTANNNTVNNNAIGGHGVLVQSRQGGSACVLLQNTGGTVDAASAEARVRQVGAATFNLKQGVSGSLVPAIVMQDNNPGVTVSVVGTITVVSNAACSTPTQAPSDISDTVESIQPQTNAGGATTEKTSVTETRVIDSVVNKTQSGASSNPFVLKTTKLDGGRVAHYSTKDNFLSLGNAPVAQQKQRGRIATPKRDVVANPPVIVGNNVTWNVGTLPGGQSVTITIQVTVDNPFVGSQVSNQGTVTADGGISLLTDDPDAAGAANPTITLVNAPPNISVLDAKIGEPASSTTPMLFTVSLSSPAGVGGVSVHYITADQAPAVGHAVAGQDYTAVPDTTLSFASGEQVKTVSVSILADGAVEPDETFLLNLSNASGGNIVRASAVGTITTNAAGTFLISEVRTSGPAGLGDDFVELYNNTSSPLTVAASDASAGYGLFKMGATCDATPVLIGTIPNGTVIPARGHYLMVGSAYSLGAYAAGNQTLTSDIESDHNVAVFTTADLLAISSANRLDAVGFGTNTGGNVCDLLREGNIAPPVSGSTAEYSFSRDTCGKGGAASGGVCPSNTPVDTNNNATDFIFADTQGTAILGVTQRLGAPGPENLASPIQRNSAFGANLLDQSVAAGLAPNRVRDLTSNPGNNSTFGTLSLRRRFTNNTGANVTRLRFRIIDISSFPSPGGGVADVRAITSADVVVSGINDAGTCAPGAPPCSVTVRGTTLESPPAQPNGGAFNSSVTAGTITLGTPLASGASISLQLLVGVQTTGTFKLYVNVEALP